METNASIPLSFDTSSIYDPVKDRANKLLLQKGEQDVQKGQFEQTLQPYKLQETMDTQKLNEIKLHKEKLDSALGLAQAATPENLDAVLSEAIRSELLTPDEAQRIRADPSSIPKLRFNLQSQKEQADQLYKQGILEVHRKMARNNADKANKAPASLQVFDALKKMSPEDRALFGYGVRGGVAPPGSTIGSDGAVARIKGAMEGFSAVEAAKASGKAAGKADAEREATREDVAYQLPKLESAIQEMDALADEATYTMVGKGVDIAAKEILGKTTKGSLASQVYLAKAKNILFPVMRATFGAQFTEKEGEKLLSTLGEAGNTPEEKKAILRAFVDEKKRQAGTTSGANSPAIRPGSTVKWGDL